MPTVGVSALQVVDIAIKGVAIAFMRVLILPLGED
jgi:hypothetical protein